MYPLAVRASVAFLTCIALVGLEVSQAAVTRATAEDPWTVRGWKLALEQLSSCVEAGQSSCARSVMNKCSSEHGRGNEIDVGECIGYVKSALKVMLTVEVQRDLTVDRTGTVRRAQGNWAAWVEDACELEAGLDNRGTAHSKRVVMCENRLTEEWLGVLRGAFPSDR